MNFRVELTATATRESQEFDEDIRQMLYGKRPHIYRVLFVVRGDVVYVLHVRHGARTSFRRDEIIFPRDELRP